MLENPSKNVLMAVNGISYLFVLTALAAGLAWVYYVAKAVEDNILGGSEGKGENDSGDSDTQVNTIRVMFQGAVVGILFYFVARHHFRAHY